jgi:hypothetical protein
MRRLGNNKFKRIREPPMAQPPHKVTAELLTVLGKGVRGKEKKIQRYVPSRCGI